MARKTQIVLLGTGNPNADPDRSGPAVAIVVDQTSYLFDCGPGVVRRAAAAADMGIEALEVRNLTNLFLTHLHSDHTAGYPDLILTPWVLGRTKPLAVYGPPGTDSMTKHVLKAYAEDIALRLHGLEHASPEGCKVRVHEFKTGNIYQDENVQVRAFTVKHGSWRHAYGFRVQTTDRTIVISGDTRPCDGIRKHSGGCDVLIHEVYGHTRFAKLPPRWRKYHASFHTSTRELAELATRVNPGLLILYHQLFWGGTDEELVSEIRQTYDGRVVSGADLDVF